jgi:lysophospholipase L1-like esterase
MKILIYGDSNTWGYVPNINGYSSESIPQQYNEEDLWWYPLKEEHEVIVDGLCGRCIDNESPWLEGRNAYKTIEEDFNGMIPDMIIVQLGTNDCKHIYGNTATDIMISMTNLIHKMETLTQAKIMMLGPVRIKPGNKITDKYYKGAEGKSIQLNELYKKLSSSKGYGFVSGLDLETGEDGEHLTIGGHRTLSKLVVQELEKHNSLDMTNN